MNAIADDSARPLDITRNEADSPAREGRATAPSKAALWAGRILSGIGVLFLGMDSVMKLLQLQPAMEGTTKLGYPTSMILPLGIAEALFLVAYLFPRTALLGAVLWTGYLGGAVATHVRLGDPLLSHTLSPIYTAFILWGGLWLRDPRVRAMIPLRSAK